LRSDGGRVEAEFEAGQHGEEDPEGEETVANAGDGQDEKAEAANGDKRLMTGKGNEEQTTHCEKKKSGGEKDLELA
jgi:hypothetical protein